MGGGVWDYYSLTAFGGCLRWVWGWFFGKGGEVPSKLFVGYRWNVLRGIVETIREVSVECFERYRRNYLRGFDGTICEAPTERLVGFRRCLWGLSKRLVFRLLGEAGKVALGESLGELYFVVVFFCYCVWKAGVICLSVPPRAGRLPCRGQGRSRGGWWRCA